MRIIAVDPGYERLGIAIIDKQQNKEALVFSTCFKTPAKEKPEIRLKMIGDYLNKLIAEYLPTALAIETLFFKNNAKTAMMVSEARGVILYECVKAGLPAYEFTPPEIKAAITGYGKSDKDNVIFMVDKLIKIKSKPKHDDEYDAIAVGLTYFATKNSLK